MALLYQGNLATDGSLFFSINVRMVVEFLNTYMYVYEGVFNESFPEMFKYMFVVHNIILLFYNVCDVYLLFHFICILTLFLLGLYVWLIFFIEPAFGFVNILFHSVSLTFHLCLYSFLVSENMDSKWFFRGHGVKKGWNPRYLFLPLQ